MTSRSRAATRVRIEDVAAAAGVSIKTISRVLNREPNVREATRRRVEEICARLEYQPNRFARGLAGQRSYVVALVYNNPSLNYLMEVQGGVLEACHAQHYNLVLAPIGDGKARTAADMRGLFEHSRPDGVVLIPPLTDNATVIAHLRDNAVPFACIAPRSTRERIGVRMDDRAAVHGLIAHLVGLGHRRIGHIMGAASHGACHWRHAGYRDALGQAGIEYDPELVVPGEFVFESGIRGGKRLLDLPSPPTAIFAANDDTAAGVIRVAGERGLSVPRDLSVCGFDDTPIARHIYPALTTVRQPTAEMGRIATLELLQHIRGAEPGRMVEVTHALVLRESTGPVPPARSAQARIAGAVSRSRTREPRRP